MLTGRFRAGRAASVYSSLACLAGHKLAGTVPP